MSQDSLYQRLSIALFLALTLLVLLTFTNYGTSWDEEGQHLYGESVFRFYLSLGAIRSFTEIGGNLHYYGGFFELLSYVSTLVSPIGLHETRHLVSALCGIVGILGCWRLARLLAGSGAAFWAALLLTLYPSYYGHMFINSKDIPFATLYIWSLYYLILLLLKFPTIPLKAAAKLGVVIGLATGIRVGGLVLLCYFWLFTAAGLANLLLRGEPHFSLKSTSRSILSCWLITTALAYATMLVLWPYGLIKPFKRPFEALELFSHYNNQSSPPDWVLRHLTFKLPEIILFLILIGCALGVGVLISKNVLKTFKTTAPYLLLIFSIVFPVLYAALERVYVYDEVRHYLFVVPPLICLLGITCDHMVGWVTRNRPVGLVAAVSVAVYLFFHVRLMTQLHPYEYAYYNRLIGGVQGAQQRGYETEYWATSYKEAVRRLEDYLHKRDGDRFESKQYRIFLKPPEFAAEYYFPSNFLRVQKPSDAEFYLFTTRYGLDETYKGLQVVQVERSGAPFAIVQELSQSDLR